MKRWNWTWRKLLYAEATMPLVSLFCFTLVFIIVMGLALYTMWDDPAPKTAYDTRADCSMAMVDADKELTEAKQEAQDWEGSYKELALNYKKIARGICFRTEKEGP